MKVPWLVKLTIGLAVVAAAGAIVDGLLDRKDAVWEARVERVVEDAKRALRAERDSALAHADSVEAHAESIVAAADARAPEIRERIRVVRETVPVPDTCLAAVAPRDSIIDELRAQADSLRLAYGHEHTAAEILRASNMRLAASVDSLVAVLEDRPRRRAWLPEIRVGPQVGIGLDGRIHTGVGINVGWKIPIKLPGPF